MYKLLQLNKLRLLFAHMLIGYLLLSFSGLNLSTFYGIIVVIIGTYYILSKPDSKSQYPILFSAYVVGLEVLLRMTNAQLFWEFGKYSVIYFLLLGIIRQRRSINILPQTFFYFLLLIPAVFIIPFESFFIWRQDVAFNLSGPACLAICSIYFYNRNLDMEFLKKILFALILPIVAVSIYNLLIMPDLSTYHFQPYSNPITSGGFGPNQVSTLFGLGIVCILACQVFRSNLFGSQIIDLIILAIFVGLGLITFSRGGIFAAIISFTFAISYFLFNNQKNIYIISKSLSLVIIVLISWYIIVSLTDGVIAQRYGISSVSYGERLVMDLTGRMDIYRIDFEIFKDNFFTGIGPGQGNEAREQYGYGKTVAAHVEYSRMLAEHGILGLISLILLISLPFSSFYNCKKTRGRFIIILFASLAMLTMTHSAMRLAIPSFIFGLIFPKYDI